MLRHKLTLAVLILVVVCILVALFFILRNSGNGANSTAPSTPPSTTPHPSGPSVLFQAQSANLSGGATVQTTHKGYSGKGYVSGFSSANAGTARAIFAVNVPAAGHYFVELRYSNGTSHTSTLSVSVNGIKSLQTPLPSTNSWDTWAQRTETLSLRAGLNTIWYTYDQKDKGTANLDSIRVYGASNAARGATLPYVEYEAESGKTNGTIIGPDRAYFTVAAESSGRKAVRLDATGQYVEITLTKPANAIDIRYSIPDAQNGGGINAPISLYVDGKKAKDILLTSKYAWVYGAYPWSNEPNQGNAHKFYDETHLLLGQELPAGTTIRLQKDTSDTAAYYIIDLIDMEQVAPAYTMPPDCLSVAEFGATPNDGKDDSYAFATAMHTAAAQGKGVWIPPGTYNIDSARIPATGVTVRGAGPWYSILTGANAGFECSGGTNNFFDFAILGDTSVRDDNAPDNGFDDVLGANSVIQNVWIEHKKCGAWVNGPSYGIYIVGCRIRNTMADGINFSGGTTDSTVEQTELRNTGDDALAVWSATYKTDAPSANNTFRFNTVQFPWLANNVGIYGGKNTTVTDNVLTDTVGFGGGINISTNFPMVPFSGTVDIERNTLTRTGGYEYNGKEPFGGIWISAIKQDIDAAILIKDNTVDDSTYQGLEIRGPHTVANLTVENLSINGAGTYGIEAAKDAQGSGTFEGVSVQDAASGGLIKADSPNFKIVKGSGNVGW